MSYVKRDWDTTGNEVTKEDFKRIENGIESNGKQINDLSYRTFGDNDKFNAAHFHRSYPLKYFSTVEKEKDLDNIKYNLFCYTTASDNLLHLPPDENGGQGILEVKCSFAGGVVNHVQQRYTRTAHNRIYERQYNFDTDSWTEWKQTATTDMLDIQYINTGTHTLSDYTEQGTYCFGSGCTITDIPTGVNGWLVVMPANNPSTTKVIKQIWMRWGTANTNSWMTFERIISGDIIGDWTQYATTRKTSFNCTAEAGYTIVNQNCFTQNCISYVRLTIKKTDNTVMSTSSVKVFTSPMKPPVALAGSLMACANNNGTTAIGGGCVDINSSGACYLLCPANSKSAIISFVIG